MLGCSLSHISVAILALCFSFSVGAQGVTGYKLGEGGGPVSGAAGPQGATDAANQLEKCDKPFGTVGVVEPQDFVQVALRKFSLPSPSGLIRLMIQQSNCFQVVERGVAMQNMMQERALAASGQLQGGSNMGQGQMVTADFVLTPDVVFSENNAGGVGGAAASFGSFFGVGGAVIGAIAGGLKFKQAQTSMLVSDARSGLQVAAATGSAEKADFGIGGLVGGLGGAVGLGAYENTAEGKVVAASFLDNYNKIVRTIKGNPSLIQAKASGASTANAANSVQSGVVFNKGDIVLPKINGVKVYATPSSSGKVAGSLKKEDELIYEGDEKDGFLRVEGSSAAGWVEKSKVRKQ
jgi:hypothetical protein